MLNLNVSIPNFYVFVMHAVGNILFADYQKPDPCAANLNLFQNQSIAAHTVWYNDKYDTLEHLISRSVASIVEMILGFERESVWKTF